MEKKVLISGIAFVYAAKAPYEKAGFSILGALEYDDETDKIRCHVCGEWFLALSRHLKTHRITAKQYKKKFGLRPTTALLGERSRIKMVEAGRVRAASVSDYGLCNKKILAETHRTAKRNGTKRGYSYTESQNKKRSCSRQILERIKSAATAMGKSPTVRELEEHNIPRAAIRFHFQTHNNALRLAGLSLTQNERGSKYTDAQLLGFIQVVTSRKGKPPSRSDVRRGLIPNRSVYQRHFGSWDKAVRLAGLNA